MGSGQRPAAGVTHMADIILLDGGMGQELVHRAEGVPTPLWSTQVMLDHPGMVRSVHADFLAAGARVATTNTYAILRDRLEGTGLEDRFTDLHDMALTEAKAAVANHGAGAIAGSIGPLRASYRPDLHPEVEVAAPIYREIAMILAPQVDLFICETVASLQHAQSLLEATRGLDRPVWLSFTVNDQDGALLRSGEALADAYALAQEADAVLINCSTPEAIPAALKAVRGFGKPFGAYANGFERISDGFLTDKPTVDALNLRYDFTPELYADHALAWVAEGATIIGGCCEVSPAHIAEIAKRLEAEGHLIAAP